VYDAAGFEAVKKRLSEFDSQKTSSSFMSQLPGLLPLWVKQIGKLFVLNSSPTVSSKIHQTLTTETFRHVSVPNIFKLHNNPKLVRQIEVLLKDEPGGLLGIELKTLEMLFKDPRTKTKFVQTLKHLIQLWELNFS
jgi:torso-like protein